MRIAQITESFSALSETFIYNYTIGLQERGYQSEVITMHRVNEVDRPYNRVHTINVPSRWSQERIRSSVRRRLGLIEKQEQLFSAVRNEIYLLLEEMQPDVIHAQFGPMGVMVAPLARSLGIPLAVSFLGYDGSRLLRNPRWQANYRGLAADAAIIIGISRNMCDQLKRAGLDASKVTYIPLGVDLTKFNYTSPQHRFDGKNIRCLHVGRLTLKKSPLSLLDAFSLARTALQSEVDLSLTIAGDGELRQAVMRKIVEMNLENCVRLLGPVSHIEVIRLYREAHIYTQYCETAPDGDSEGQGVTFVEASASGLPIVSTRHGGIPDVVLDRQTGYLAEEGDIRGMAEHIVELVRDPDSWTVFGRAGRSHVEEHFTLDKQLDRTIAIYERIIGK